MLGLMPVLTTAVLAIQIVLTKLMSMMTTVRMARKRMRIRRINVRWCMMKRRMERISFLEQRCVRRNAHVKARIVPRSDLRQLCLSHSVCLCSVAFFVLRSSDNRCLVSGAKGLEA